MLEVLKGAAGVGALAWYASSIYVGARLLRLGLRDDYAPARWIGTYLFFAMGLGSILYMVVAVRTVLADAPMTPIDRVLILVHFVAALIANHGLLTFTHRVFRRESVVARLVAALLFVSMIAGAVGHGLETGFDARFESVYAGIYLAVPVIGNAWAAGESLAYYRMMRRRIALGLGEPVIANRFLLYGVAAGMASVLLGVNLFDMQVMSRLRPGWTDGVQLVSLSTMAVLGLACAGAYLFAFSPPRWLARRGPVSAGEGC